MNTTTSIRIADERRNCGLTQSDLANELGKRLGRVNYVSTTAVSTWETGRRIPGTTILKELALIFKCSTDYLLGLKDTRQESTDKQKKVIRTKKNDPNADLKVDISELKKYDKKPVYVVFTDLLYSPSWGILNFDTGIIHFPDMDKKISDLISCEFYICEPLFVYDTIGLRRPSTYASIQEHTVFEVYSKSEDPRLREKYTGIFRHNEDKTCLINQEGYTLPYDGNGVSYIAFTVK